jgi:hypothetical protein
MGGEIGLKTRVGGREEGGEKIHRSSPRTHIDGSGRP